MSAYSESTPNFAPKLWVQHFMDGVKDHELQKILRLEVEAAKSVNNQQRYVHHIREVKEETDGFDNFKTFEALLRNILNGE